LVRHSSDVLAVVDVDGRFRYENDSIRRVLGYDPGDLVGRPAAEYVHPEDADRAATLFDDDESVTVEVRVRAIDGTWVPVEVVATSTAEANGYVIDARPIAASPNGGPDTGALLDRMTDGFYALNADWEVTHLNERARSLLADGDESLVGTELWSVLPEARGTVVEERFTEAVDTGETVTFETFYDPFDAHFEVSVYPDEAGLTVYFRDVTEHERTRAELENSVQALHGLYEIAANPDLSFEVKRRRLLELGNSYFDLPYGFATRVEDGVQTIEASTGTHELLQPGETCPLEESYCRKTIQRDAILSVADATDEGWEDDRAFEVFGLGSYVGSKLVVDGELYGTLCFAATKSRGEFSGSERTFVELAARWLAYELEQRRYNERLEERNQRLEEFASIVSHDLRNPLNVAEGELEMARERHGDDEHFAAVAESHERMSTLIEDLLTLARRGDSVGDLEPVHLGDLTTECWDGVASDGATFRSETDAIVRADESRLRQVLENLLRNTVDHGGDEVTVTVGDLSEGFYVADDGPGIPEADHERAFEGGFTTIDEGTGFGLRIVAEIADAHGWTVSVTESEAGGARFEFTGVDVAD
jgi:PAS domain S-box-containing protein